jgi:site-specific DNA-methyltransferase (adenine-specific)
MKPITTNTLFYGDNLPILREYIADESVDLIYLDPPFNSNRSYNVLFKDERGAEADAQIEAFDDTWHWGARAEHTYKALVENSPERVSAMIGALRQFIGANQMMAYLVMMAARLVELHRVLKSSGSLYLHCDPTASHYLKIVLDAIFGGENFVNEIIWKRTSAHSSGKKFGPVHDSIFVYGKTQGFIWNPQHRPFDEEYTESHYKNIENGRQYKRQDLTGAGVRHGETGKMWRGINPTPKGRHWMYTPAELEKLDAQGLIYWPQKEGAWPYLKLFLDERSGMLVQDVWDDINPVNPVAKERLGYPTQKPLALLERIISASSNEGDIVLDPFCGCGTAVAAAQKLGRKWIGIDITHLSIALQKNRLKDMFDLKPGKDYQVIGEPQDLASARQLAKDSRYQFQFWALSLVQARPLGGSEGSKQGKKGSDKGVDGIITFIDDPRAKPKRALVQVKSGHTKSGDVRDLRGTVEREDAAIGIFITLEPATREMEKEAVAAGFYHSALIQRDFPKLQILAIEELLNDAEPKLPIVRGTFKQAERVRDANAKQKKMEL